MTTIVPMDIPQVGTVYLETDSVELIESTSMKDIKSRVDKTFVEAMDTIKALAVGTFTTMKSIEEQVRPSEYNIEFGVSLSSEVGAIVARTAANATIKVSITWSAEKKVSSKANPS